MKSKLISALILSVLLTAGCQDKESQAQIDELNRTVSQLTEQNKRLEMDLSVQQMRADNVIPTIFAEEEAVFQKSETINYPKSKVSLMPMLTLGAVDALFKHGSEEQKQAYLPKMCSGEWAGTMNLSEPQAGSDLNHIATRAVPKENGAYALSGQKIFITWGDQEMTENIVHLVLARLPDAAPGVQGVSMFIVPKYLVNADGSLGGRNGVRAIGIEHKLGIHASPTCTMEFDNAEGYLVGRAGKGLAYMFTMMKTARLNVGIEGHAVAERAYQNALAYAKERVQGRDEADGSDDVAIIRHPDVRRMLLIYQQLGDSYEQEIQLSLSVSKKKEWMKHWTSLKKTANHVNK